MGYHGLDNVGDSDMAADAASEAIDAMVKILRKSLKLKENEFNTSGPINVALFFEEYLLPSASKLSNYDELTVLAQDTLKAMKDEILDAKEAHWDNEKNKNYHITAYKRMVRHLEQYVEKVGLEW